MFVIVYRWTIRSELQSSFTDAWSRMTHLLATNHGSLGSRLHRTDDGEWLAYAQWPDRETWQRWDDAGLTEEETRLTSTMKAATERRAPRLMMEVVEDHLRRPDHPEPASGS